MQYELEHGMPLASTQNSHTEKHEFLPMEKGQSQVEMLVDERQFLRPPTDLDSLGEITQKLLTQEQQGIRRRRLSPMVWYLTLMVGDGVLLVFLLALILMLIPHFHLLSGVWSNGLESWNLKLVWIFLMLVLWSISVKITNAQELTNVSTRFKSPLYAVFALSLTFILWMVLTYPFISNGTTYIKVLLFCFVLAVPAFSIWRVILAELMNQPCFRPLAVVVGANTAGEVIAKELQSKKRPNATIVGYIGEGSEEKLKLAGLPILGARSMLRYLVHSGMIDMIIIALDYKADPELFKEVTEAAHLGISVVPMPIAYENMSGKIPVGHIGDQWYLALPMEVVISPLYLCFRKGMDVFFGLVGTAVLLLILPILAPLIYLDSSGPIFYSQERLGVRGKPFRIYKFRSMHANAEHNGRAVWATENDARVTRVGRFMRMFHLDEFPQVLNILRGDMSLIGPRPEREEFAVKLEKNIPFFRCRLAAKPGLTGWAQVKYHYASSDDDTLIKLQYDLYYIKHQSFMLDIFILLMTFAEVFLHRGT